MSERIELRVTPEEKTHWQAIAASRGVSLSELIRVALSGQRLRSRRGVTRVDPACVFRESWAAISRDLGHAFHAILGSHFADVVRLADGFMESGLIGSVKRFRDVSPASQAFS